MNRIACAEPSEPLLRPKTAKNPTFQGKWPPAAPGGPPHSYRRRPGPTYRCCFDWSAVAEANGAWGAWPRTDGHGLMLGTLIRRPRPAPIGVRGAAGGRGGPFSLKSWIFGRFWPQEWSGWVRTGRRIHLVFVSGQTVDSKAISDQI